MSGTLGLLPPHLRNTIAVHLGKPDIRFSLIQLKRFGFQPRQALDVGAFRGDWAKTCLEVWPNVRVLCIEPQQAPQSDLNEFARQNVPRVTVNQCLIGADDREAVPFNEIGTGSSVLDSSPRNATRPMRSIDSLVDAGDCNPPEFVKLDVQGYELQVLEGFDRHLPTCQVLQMELSLVPIVPGAPIISDVTAYLKARGFEMFDVDEVIRAPSDGAVWQIDALFCRNESPLRLERRWA